MTLKKHKLPDAHAVDLTRFFQHAVLPKQSIDELRPFKCLYGLSIGATDKSVDLVRYGYSWTFDRFAKVAILVGDSLYRISLQITEGLSPATATRKSALAGQQMLDEISSGLETEPTVIRTSEVMNKTDFAPALQLITSLHQVNTDLRESICSDARKFVARQHKRGRLGIDQATATDLAVHYLHEEIAVYLVLAEEGWLVDVYIGDELPTLRRIINGEIPDAPTALIKRVNVSLRPISPFR